MNGFWRDKERRRAAMLSLVLHGLMLFAIIGYVSLPRPEPLDPFIVIEVGSPAPAEETADAAAADAPAPEAEVPQVDATEVGQPAAETAPEAQPEETGASAPPEVAEEPAPAEAETAEAESPDAPTDAAATDAGAAEAAPPEPSEPDDAPQAEDAPRPAPPRAVAPPPRPVAQALPASPASALPDIEEEPLAPRPLASSIPVPAPQVEASVPTARDIAPQPRAQVAEARDVPTPSVQASVAPQRDVPTPAVEASVADAREVPTPEPSTEVAEPRTVPSPQARAEVAEPRAVPSPQARAEVAEARAVPSPQARAEVAEARTVPSPQARAEVAEARAVPSPQAQAQVAEPRSVPAPSVTATGPTAAAVPRPQVSVASPAAREVPRPTATASTSAARTVPQPTVTAEVRRPVAAEDPPEGVPLPDATRADVPTPGGNAARAGERAPAEEAEGLGVAAAPEGERSTGAPARPEPYSEFRRQPVSVLIDNANGYPQSGLIEASVVVEMPVEGGLSRLMTIYDNNDPGDVGPVRSARDYFVRVAASYDSVLVHDGGSPSAIQAIEQSPAPTLNAFARGDLFGRVDARDAPYNLYAVGSSLRNAVNRLRAGGLRPVSGTIFRPPEDAREVDSVTVRYGGSYRTGFAFDTTLGSYRWVRNGAPAVDGRGDQVRADAVLVAAIDARPYPDDPEGRLYIPLDGGPATLYLRGRAVEGTWSLDGGVRFTAEDETAVDLRPFKTWIVFATAYDGRVEE